MKCPKCEKNERSAGQSYCRICHAKIAKEKRIAHATFLLERPKPSEPIAEYSYVPVSPVQSTEEPVVPLISSTTNQPNLIYWSAYVTKDSELYHQFKAIEAQYVTS